jgi:hypothetical protein
MVSTPPFSLISCLFLPSRATWRARSVDDAAAGLEDVGPEQARGAVELPAVHVEQGAEVLVGLIQELQTAGLGLVAAESVFHVAGRRVVDPVAAALVQTGEAPAQGPRRDRAADAAADVDGVVGAEGRAEGGVELTGLAGLELDDAGGGVAAEQGALGTTQNLDALQVEQGHALDHRVLEDHVVDDQGHRLRGVEVEVGVAETADVEAREGAAEGRLDDAGWGCDRTGRGRRAYRR